MIFRSDFIDERVVQSIISRRQKNVDVKVV